MKCITKIWKVYGLEGHRQRQTFSKSMLFDSTRKGLARRMAVWNFDVTGTHDYSVVEITRNTIEECDDEFQGQLSDGFFENCRVGKIEEIKIEQYNIYEEE